MARGKGKRQPAVGPSKEKNQICREERNEDTARDTRGKDERDDQITVW